MGGMNNKLEKKNLNKPKSKTQWHKDRTTYDNESRVDPIGCFYFLRSLNKWLGKELIGYRYPCARTLLLLYNL